MFISIKKKILFFHISKTAGTSITSMLKMMCPDGPESYHTVFHENMDHYMTKRVRNKWNGWEDEDKFTHITQTDARPFFKAAGLDYNDFFCFTVVRNPYERFKSQLQYLNLLDMNSVDHYINTYKDSLNNRLAGYWFRSQMDYVKDPLTKKINVYKFEELDKLWAKLQEFNDHANPMYISHVNDNPNKSKYTVNFTLEQKKKIHNIFKEEFETFGYSPEFPYSSGL